MGPFKAEVPVFAILWPSWVQVPVRVSFMTGAVRSAMLATAGLHVMDMEPPSFPFPYSTLCPIPAMCVGSTPRCAGLLTRERMFVFSYLWSLKINMMIMMILCKR